MVKIFKQTNAAFAAINNEHISVMKCRQLIRLMLFVSGDVFKVIYQNVPV